MRQIRLPISELMAERIGVDRDAGGYSTVRMIFDPAKMGKFVTFVADHLQDCETDIPHILTRDTMFTRMRDNDLVQLRMVSEPADYARLIQRLSRSANYWTKNLPASDGSSPSRIDVLEGHFLIKYAWEPLDLVTMTPEVWLMTQCQKMRHLGLIYRLGEHIPPTGVMESMGHNLLHLARQKSLV